MNGKLIVIEGLDGSGKATQSALLRKALEEKGIKVRGLSFPDYSSLSSGPVRMYLNGEFGGSPDDVLWIVFAVTGLTGKLITRKKQYLFWIVTRLRIWCFRQINFPLMSGIVIYAGCRNSSMVCSGFRNPILSSS